MREEWIGPGVRLMLNASGNFDAKRPTRVVLFATPNGNTAEQTLGCAPAAGIDWRFDIQHVAAQVRRLRELCPDENVVLACVEAEGLAWPAWRKKNGDRANGTIREIVGKLKSRLPGRTVRFDLACHSGGGSFLIGFIESADEIPAWVERIVFLDANYSYSNDLKHGDKLLAWLKADAAHRLTVIAYDDRKITLDGKLVVSATGGTYRATERMRERFKKDVEFEVAQAGDLTTETAFDGRLTLKVHANPANKILHTALVGEMNGLLEGLAYGRKLDWGTFGGPRAYTKWIQPAPGIPARPAKAIGGREFAAKIAPMKLDAREEAIAAEILAGNFPEFLRQFATVTFRGNDAAGKERLLSFETMPDYLAVGSDADFVRIPMTPQTAQRIADAFGCALPTRKMVDDINKAAVLKLEPKPLTKDREAVETFLLHSRMIEEQRGDKKLGPLVSGIKKDIVVSNRLAEKPKRLALYGWHTLDGKAIQPLTIVHWDRYVDYSHGARLVKRTVKIDGKPMDSRYLLHSTELNFLMSDEGILQVPSY